MIRSAFASALAPSSWTRDHALSAGARWRHACRPRLPQKRQRSSRLRASGAPGQPTKPRNDRRREEKLPGGELSQVGTQRPIIQWYPGHIAKAERQLKETLKLVDVVIEVRDCRIPRSTGHPLIKEWIGSSRGHVLVMNRADMAPDCARGAWRSYLQGESPRFVNSKLGRGVKELKKAAVAAGDAVNEKRKRRGLLPRAVRCMVLGFPNVGKSALINRLVGKRAVKSQNKPGVTRSLQWVRLSNELELLDTPGIIPAKLIDQNTALRLALCDDIGQAAYDSQIVAAALLDELVRADRESPGYVDLAAVERRYAGISTSDVSGQQFLELVSVSLFRGDSERAAMRLLTDFRTGVLGPVTLEAPPSTRKR